MTKYVDIDAVKEAVRGAECDADWDGRRFDAEFIENALDFIPAADVVPVVHGRWNNMDGYKTRKVCSECGWDVPEYGKFYSYCPNCGAKMDGGVDNETD